MYDDTSLAVSLFLINAFLNDCPYPVVYRIEVWSVGRPHVWCEVRSLVTAAQCSCADVVHWKVSYQQLDRCMAATVWACTIHFHLWLHENHTSARTSAWRHRLKPTRRTCLSETSEVCSWAEMASDWNMVSNQQSFIDQSIDQWRDRFIACLKAKTINTLKICYDVFLYDM